MRGIAFICMLADSLMWDDEMCLIDGMEMNEYGSHSALASACNEIKFKCIHIVCKKNYYLSLS